MEEETPRRDTILFVRLLLMLQSAAMQQLGKLKDPLTGTMARDLGEARATIDTLDMLRDRCRGNLSSEEERLLNHILSELRLNYVDEAGRPASAVSDTPASQESPAAEAPRPTA